MLCFITEDNGGDSFDLVSGGATNLKDLKTWTNKIKAMGSHHRAKRAKVLLPHFLPGNVGPPFDDKRVKLYRCILHVCDAIAVTSDGNINTWRSI